MGKVSRWFRSLLGSKRPENGNVTAPHTDAKLTPSRRWSFSKSTTNCNHTPSPSSASALPRFQLKDEDYQQHAITAAAEVRWLSTGKMNELKGNVNTTGYVRRSYNGDREYWVAVKIQSHFRAYLARKALRALKGLVKLQALVRGHIVRKQIAERLLQMQAALCARTRARALRAQIYESSQSAIKPSHINYLGPATPENSEHDLRRSRSSKHEQSVMLERNGSHSHSFITSKDSIHHQAFFSPSSGEEQPAGPLKFTNEVNEALFFAAETRLQFIPSKSASFTRSGPFTTTRSKVSKSCQSDYSDYFPSYMSDTESSKAKVRSLSAPRQKTQLERSNTAKRFPLHTYYGNMESSTLHSNFISKGCPGSGRLNRHGMPLGSTGVGFSGGLLSSY